MRRARLPDPPLGGGVGYPLGSVAAVAVTILMVAAHATGHPQWNVVALAVTAAAVATVTTLPAALATAAVCWALHAGFVLGRHGELQFSPASAEAAAVLATVTLVAYAGGAAVRTALRNRRPTTRRATTIPHPRTPVTSRFSGSRNGPRFRVR